MKKAYDRTEKTGAVYSSKSDKFNKKVKKSIMEMQTFRIFFPITALIFVQLKTDDMFVAVIAAILACATLYIPGKKVKASDFCDLWIQGFAATIPTLAIIALIVSCGAFLIAGLIL